MPQLTEKRALFALCQVQNDNIVISGGQIDSKLGVSLVTNKVEKLRLTDKPYNA